MPQEPRTFHDQLLFFLQEDLQKKKDEEGWDDRFDGAMRNYSDSISRAIRSSAPMPLEEIIEQHKYLFERGPVHLEQKLLLSFPDHEMSALQFKPLRIYRGLPRLYRKNQPQISKLKPNFSHLPSLKRSAAAKSIYSLYSQASILPTGSKMAILCWVIPDGWGDYFASIEAAKLICNAFPSVELHLIATSEKELPRSDFAAIRWEGSESQYELLRRCDLILEIPTVYPKIDEIKTRIESMADESPMPAWESIGQYGFLESDWFHPSSGAHSMGLHFLERGILTRSVDEFQTILGLENEQMIQWMFDQRLTAETVEQNRQTHRFFLAYLFSNAGIFVYIHALLKSLENDNKDIDLCVPDPGKMLAYFEERFQAGLDPIEKSFQIGQIVIYIGGNAAVWNLAPAGKTLRILCPEFLSSSDFQRLIAYSEDFVACRGDQSLSEVVSHHKCFFYDPRDHSRFFLKDLIALAQNRIAQYPSSIAVLRLFAKILEHNLLQDTADWVDEISIDQQKMDLMDIANAMGQYLQDPKTFAGFKKLDRILLDEHSCNDFILNLVRRAFCHKSHPDVKRIEEEQLAQFAYGQKSFSSIVDVLQKEIARRTN